MSYLKDVLGINLEDEEDKGIREVPPSTPDVDVRLRTPSEQRFDKLGSMGISISTPVGYEAPSPTFDVFDVRSWGYDIKPQSYNEYDVHKNPEMMADVRKAVSSFYGDLWEMEDKSDREVVDIWYNIMRGTQTNLPRGLSTSARIKWLENNDPERLVDVGKGMAIFESSGNIFKGSWKDLGEGVMDYLREALLDPANLVSAGIGGKVGTRVLLKEVGSEVIEAASMSALRSAATKEGLEAGLKAKTKEGLTKPAEEVAEVAFRKATAKRMKEGTKALGKSQMETIAVQRAAREAARSQGVKQLFSKPALAELGTVVGIDTVVGVGLEWMYQDDLTRAGVQEEIKWSNVGMAALGSLILGGAVGGGMLLRGVNKGVGVSESLHRIKGDPTAIPKGIAKEVADEVAKRGAKGSSVEKSLSWVRKVEQGKKLPVAELTNDFFRNILTGVRSEDGSIESPSIFKAMAESGLGWKKQFEDDTFSDWLTDVISTWDDKSVRDMVGAVAKASDIEITDLGKLTAKEFSNRIAASTSEVGSALGTLGAGAKQFGISMDDLVRRGLVVGDVTPEKVASVSSLLGETAAGRFTASVEDFQSKLIRLMVSNFSTSYLNAAGWAGASAFNIASDLVWAALHIPTNAVLNIFGKGTSYRGAKETAQGLLKSAANRPRYLLDAKTTYEDFKSFDLHNQYDMSKLSESIAGGVDMSDKFYDKRLGHKGRLFMARSDQAVEMAQRLAGVQGVDMVTKSVEWMSEFDRALRVDGVKMKDGSVVRYKGGVNEFLDPNAKHAKNMLEIQSTKGFHELQANVTARVQEAIYSKSYKNDGTVGKFAGLIEDVRKVPFLGMLVPFGRFWNNTVRFISEALGVSLAAKTMGMFKHREGTELFARAVVGWSTMLTFAYMQKDYDDKGIPFGSLEMPNGQIQDFTYDFPVALPVMGGRIFSSKMRGDDVPPERVEALRKQFGLMGALRGVSDTNRDLKTIGDAIISGDFDKGMREFGKAVGVVGAQSASAATRFLEPVNIAVGLARGANYIEADRRQAAISGNVYVDNGLRYLDQIAGALVGGEIPAKKTVGEGIKGPNPQKITGIRVYMPSTTVRFLSGAGFSTYKEDIEAAVRDMAPEVGNDMAGLFFRALDHLAEKEIDSGKYFKASVAERRGTVRKTVNKAREIARNQLAFGSFKRGDTADLQYKVASHGQPRKIRKAMDDLDFGNDLGKLTRKELEAILEYVKTMDERNTYTYWNR